VDKASAYFATHPDMVLGLFGRYREESGLELKTAIALYYVSKILLGALDDFCQVGVIALK
jgi:hypothetical protein